MYDNSAIDPYNNEDLRSRTQGTLHNKAVGTIYRVILFSTCLYFHYVFNIVVPLRNPRFLEA